MYDVQNTDKILGRDDSRALRAKQSNKQQKERL